MEISWEEEAIGFKLECTCRTHRTDSTFIIYKDDNGNIFVKCTLCKTEILLIGG